MSHHLDSPSARQDVRLDATDLYVFRGETGTVLAINVCHSIAGPIPVPGFHPEGRYEFKVDLNRDAIEDITYRFTFDDRDAAGKQRFVLRRIAGEDAADPNAAGEVVARGSTGDRVITSDGFNIWAGLAGETFWNDLDVIHAVGHAFHDGTAIDLSKWDPAKASNGFKGYTVYSIVLEVPDKGLIAADGGKRIGAWAVATLATDAGGWRPINRIGLPMLSPLFAQFDDDLSEQFNKGRPADDHANWGDLVAKAVAGVVAASGTSDDPQRYGERVARLFLPNILPYEVGTPAAFDFLGWNGRALTDNAPVVMTSIAANAPVPIGVGKESVIPAPRSGFPYVPPAA
jgi:hypothetical protein